MSIFEIFMLLIWFAFAVALGFLLGSSFNRGPEGSRYWFVATVYDGKGKKVYRGAPDMAWHIITHHTKKSEKYTIVTNCVTTDPRCLEA